MHAMFGFRDTGRKVTRTYVCCTRESNSQNSHIQSFDISELAFLTHNTHVYKTTPGMKTQLNKLFEMISVILISNKIIRPRSFDTKTYYAHLYEKKFRYQLHQSHNPMRHYDNLIHFG